MPDKQKSSANKKPRDGRTHSERIIALNTAFAKLKVNAITSGNKTEASAEKVLSEAGVHRSYFWQKDKLKDTHSLAYYHEVRDNIKAFQESFDEYVENTPVKKLMRKLTITETENKKLEEQFISQERQILALQESTKVLRSQLQVQNANLVNIVHSEKANTAQFRNVFGEAKIVSPDQYCIRKGQYLWADTRVRKQAWERAREDLNTLLARRLPTRVYILIGPPCAGKTHWSEQPQNFYPDLHPVVIDATNLTYTSRLEWMVQINKYRHTGRLKICAVVFLTPKAKLQSRNNMRQPTKHMEDALLLEKLEMLEFPDVVKEDFDELIVVRGEEGETS